MTIKAYTLAITIAVVSPLTIAMTGASLASPALSGASELKAAAPIALTDVKYRKHAPQYWNYSADWSYPASRQKYDSSSEQFCYLPSEPCGNDHRVTN
jgi:hypothetical protein